MQKLMRWFTNQGSISFLALLISIDLAFIITHIVYENLAIVEYDNFSITKDRGYSEIFQYLKLGLIAICFGTLNFLRKRRIYAAWSLLSLIILLDDMFVLHEKVGKRLCDRPFSAFCFWFKFLSFWRVFSLYRLWSYFSGDRLCFLSIEARLCN